MDEFTYPQKKSGKIAAKVVRHEDNSLVDFHPSFPYYVAHKVNVICLQETSDGHSIGHFTQLSPGQFRAYSLVVRNQRFTFFVRSLGNVSKLSFHSCRSKVEFWSLIITPR